MRYFLLFPPPRCQTVILPVLFLPAFFRSPKVNDFTGRPLHRYVLSTIAVWRRDGVVGFRRTTLGAVGSSDTRMPYHVRFVLFDVAIPRAPEATEEVPRRTTRPLLAAAKHGKTFPDPVESLEAAKPEATEEKFLFAPTGTCNTGGCLLPRAATPCCDAGPSAGNALRETEAERTSPRNMLLTAAMPSSTRCRS
eukprot:927677-Rhodomonas_salina.12